MTVSAHDNDELWESTASGMSQVVSAAGRLVVVSGQVAFDQNANLVGAGDFEAQAVQVFENLGVALVAAGATFADVVRLGSYLADIGNLGLLREVRMRYLAEPFPAATAVQAELATPELLIEIDALAVVG
jgi:enamine deaminase RidA (YjgF/YER057c/UK114 family)